MASFIQKLQIGQKTFSLHSLAQLAKLAPHLHKLPFSLKILLENLLRFEDGRIVKREHVEALLAFAPGQHNNTEISFTPARVLLQDFTGVPCVVDLAAMREALSAMGKNPQKINPLSPVDLVIDHSVMVDFFGSTRAFDDNVALEFERNQERYAFLKWGQKTFQNFRAVPPDTGICHQVNLEYLAQVAFLGPNQQLYCDSLVGTDSHTTMVNGLGVLGWGVGGIEAEAAMLGQPISMLIPEVVGVCLKGQLPEGATATDAVLTLTQMLRKKGVVGKFVEFFGPGMHALPLTDRATIANMAPEYGATMGFFPVDERTLEYLRLTGRSEENVAIVEAFCKHQGLFASPQHEPLFSDTLELDLATVVPCLAGPARPQDNIPLAKLKTTAAAFSSPSSSPSWVQQEKQSFELQNGSVVIAAITSCTNTSNPSVLLAAGLLAKKAVQQGLVSQTWVKTSLSPGSQVAVDYLSQAGLLPYLEALGFHVTGFGCTTCIGNSGPLPQPLLEAIAKGNLNVAAVLSGNRNFEGRIHPQVKLNFLASPPLVVAFALHGNVNVDLSTQAVGTSRDGRPVFLKDIWPSNEEIQQAIATSVKPEYFQKRYAQALEGNALWKALKVPKGDTFVWDETSTYVRKPPFFQGIPPSPAPLKDIVNARALALLGDSVTTDHISPAGNIAKNSPAAQYLVDNGVHPRDFNSYGARRGNHEVMVRGTFANIRLKNLLLPGSEGGVSIHLPSGQTMSIYEAAMRYGEEKTPLLVLAGAEYGTGSSRDWAAKGPCLLGIRMVVAKSFERIHRSNLVGMGILPLQFVQGQDTQNLGLDGTEFFSLENLSQNLKPQATLLLHARHPSGKETSFNVLARIDTPNELDYYVHGGILQYVLRQLAAEA
ncbi:MAG: aconitate hydratase AcnA [Proteobacteria bacterium]|nr:aconitate hydratase AcnA [Cystobacterineae bacterium]MCL2313718.1 aconitate hydratase AcnA [Pseudomonadota bacterium]